MNLISRIKSILFSPQTEWRVIEKESTSPGELTRSYLLPLALIPAIATFIGLGFIGYRVMGEHFGSIGIGFRQAITSIISTLAGTFITTLVINYLATHFDSQNNFKETFKLVVYSYTPMLVAGIFFLIPSLSVLTTLCGLYGLYLLYLGLGPIMKTPEEKRTSFFIVTFIVLIVVFMVVGAILGALLFSTGMGIPRF